MRRFSFSPSNADLPQPSPVLPQFSPVLQQFFPGCSSFFRACRSFLRGYSRLPRFCRSVSRFFVLSLFPFRAEKEPRTKSANGSFSLFILTHCSVRFTQTPISVLRGIFNSDKPEVNPLRSIFRKPIEKRSSAVFYPSDYPRKAAFPTFPCTARSISSAFSSLTACEESSLRMPESLNFCKK